MLHWSVPAAAMLIPLTAGMDAMRQVLFPAAEGFLSVPVELGLLAGLSVVFLIGARWTLRVLEQKARRDGTLTVKWQ
jgi:ABC-2 type transport system permease protein